MSNRSTFIFTECSAESYNLRYLATVPQCIMVVGIPEFQVLSCSLVRRLRDSVISRSAYTNTMFALLHQSLPDLRSNHIRHEAHINRFDSHSYIILYISSSSNGTSLILGFNLATLNGPLHLSGRQNRNFQPTRGLPQTDWSQWPGRLCHGRPRRGLSCLPR